MSPKNDGDRGDGRNPAPTWHVWNPVNNGMFTIWKAWKKWSYGPLLPTPDAQCRVYIPTFYPLNYPIVGKYPIHWVSGNIWELVLCPLCKMLWVFHLTAKTGDLFLFTGCMSRGARGQCQVVAEGKLGQMLVNKHEGWKTSHIIHGVCLPIFNSWICLRWFLYFLPWQITIKPPFGDFFPTTSSKSKYLVEDGMGVGA